MTNGEQTERPAMHTHVFKGANEDDSRGSQGRKLAYTKGRCAETCRDQDFRAGRGVFSPHTLFWGRLCPRTYGSGRGSDDALSHLSLPGRGNRRGGALGPNLESHLSQIRGRLSAQSLSNRSK